MEVFQIAGVGAVDLEPEPTVAALERIVQRLGYVLEWRPGAKTWKASGCAMRIFWRYFPERGTWLDLPLAPHDRKIATALVQELGRPLIYHEAIWLIDANTGSLQVRSSELQSDGSLRSRPTGLEGADLDTITSGRGEERVDQLLRRMMGLLGCKIPARGKGFYLFELDAAGALPDSGPYAPVNDSRLNQALDLLRQPSIRGKLERTGIDQFILNIFKQPTTHTFYINYLTAEALKQALRGADLPPLQSPSIA